MPRETAKGASNVDVSQETPAKQEATGSEALATTQGAAIQGQGADLHLSQDVRDRLSLELAELMHAVEMGFDKTTKPSDILAAGQVFDIVDGILIDNFEDRTTGEVKSKCVFRLEYPDGRVVNVMQSAARPRAVYAQLCETARSLGLSFRAGPFKFAKKGVGQIQDAVIFEQQPGWKQEVY